MRLGLDLRGVRGDSLVDRCVEADRLGVWAVLLDGDAGLLAAAELAVATEHVHLSVHVAESHAHATTVAEEMAVLDHLSRRRALAVVSGMPLWTDHLRRLLAGHIIDGFALAPPPAQAAVPVWAESDTGFLALSGDLNADRFEVDQLRDAGVSHAFARWGGSLPVFARHLVTRALTSDFPQITSDYADVIAPLD